MPDREKVIAGLKCCVGLGGCDECPYGPDARACMEPLHKDALKLLKSQNDAIPIDFLMKYAQLPTEFAIEAWKKPQKELAKIQARMGDKPMSFDEALQAVRNDIISSFKNQEENEQQSLVGATIDDNEFFSMRVDAVHDDGLVDVTVTFKATSETAHFDINLENEERSDNT